MKKCSYCGAEYPDDVVVCPLDQTPCEDAQLRGGNARLSRHVSARPRLSPKARKKQIDRFGVSFMILAVALYGVGFALFLGWGGRRGHGMMVPTLLLGTLVLLHAIFAFSFNRTKAMKRMQTLAELNELFRNGSITESEYGKRLRDFVNDGKNG